MLNLKNVPIVFLMMAAALAGSPAGAATICVEPTGAGGCQTTIQAAVNLAAAGDAVEIQAGLYNEQIGIPAGKDGLILMGESQKRSIIDCGSPATGDGGGNGIRILSDNVTVAALTIRNCYSNNGVQWGDGVVLLTSGLLTDVLLTSTFSDCVNIAANANGIVVDASRLVGCSDQCVDSSAAGTTITGSVLQQADNGCIEIEGNNATVTGNTISECEDDEGVEIYGDDATVVKNKITLADGGVFVRGNGSHTVTGNKISALNDDAGVALWCDGTCTAALIASNKISGLNDDADGIQVRDGVAGVIVEKNKITDASDSGVDIEDGTGVVVRGNKVTRGGWENEAGILVNGTGHTVERNSVQKVNGSGFGILGSGHTFIGNKSRANLRDGFFIDATDVTLTANQASANLGQGIHAYLGATATLTDNTASGNRNVNGISYDFCDDAGGGIIDGGGNSFAVAGAPGCELF